jgi:hypothetical protein
LVGRSFVSAALATLSVLRQAVIPRVDTVLVVQGDVKVSLALKIRVAEEV